MMAFGDFIFWMFEVLACRVIFQFWPRELSMSTTARYKSVRIFVIFVRVCIWLLRYVTWLVGVLPIVDWHVLRYCCCEPTRLPEERTYWVSMDFTRKRLTSKTFQQTVLEVVQRWETYEIGKSLSALVGDLLFTVICCNVFSRLFTSYHGLRLLCGCRQECHAK
jgi:hypothetical protein